MCLIQSGWNRCIDLILLDELPSVAAAGIGCLVSIDVVRIYVLCFMDISRINLAVYAKKSTPTMLINIVYTYNCYYFETTKDAPLDNKQQNE